MSNIVMILDNGFDPDPRVYKEGVYLVSKGFSVTILCWDRDIHVHYPPHEVIEGIEIIRYRLISELGTGKKQFLTYLKFIKKCREYINKHRVDYLHCNDLDGAIVSSFCRTKSTKIVFDMHEVYEEGGRFSRWLIRKATIHYLKKSIAGLYENAFYLNKSYSKVHFKLFPLKNYPDSEMIFAESKTISDVFRIGYHGVVRFQIEEFSALFEVAKELGDSIRIDINGNGPDLDKLMQISSGMNNVFIHGPFDGTKDLRRLYQNTDILFCGYDPNLLNYQGDGEVVKFYEAIVTGTPMIMTDGIGMSNKVRDNGYGICCNTRNSQEIKAAIERFIADREFYSSCAHNELKDAYKYDWKTAVRILDKIYV